MLAACSSQISDRVNKETIKISVITPLTGQLESNDRLTKTDVTLHFMNPSIMRFLFPSDAIKPKKPDSTFIDSIAVLKEMGYQISFVSLESLHQGKYQVFPAISENETILYRGWMMTHDEYTTLSNGISAHKATMLTNPKTYLQCHHLPNWYPLISEFTPKTLIFPPDADLKTELETLNWPSYFIKDYVKSLKIASGSLLESTDDVPQLIANMIKFRQGIEGGFCVREVEEFVPDSETRYFVVQGIPYAHEPEHRIPKIVHQVADRINSPFFTIDVVQHRDGRDRVVELGDGQVSDLVGWTPQRLAAIIAAIFPPSY
ncbi:MAG TPA: hypothetical protein DD761_18610 [Cyanobacteria bacterium UBA11691]|nr:hypothetical protein [Cyanobacteria bacterium UBA11691]